MVMAMIVKTRVFELCDRHYKNLSELAQAMEISVSQIYRVREGTRNINQKFIVGAIKAFPGYRFDDLFYFALESPIVTNRHRHVVQQYTKPDPPGQYLPSSQWEWVFARGRRRAQSHEV